MSLPLLATKFNIPATSPKLVRRLRLLRLLDESLDQNARLILVCAPAGYGKTTVVSEWLHDSHRLPSDRFAWLTLERGDDDLTEEVLTRLPEHLRSFLLQTSILERLSAALCEAVTGQPGAQDNHFLESIHFE